MITERMKAAMRELREASRSAGYESISACWFGDDEYVNIFTNEDPLGQRDDWSVWREPKEAVENADDYDFFGKNVFLSGPMTGIDGWNREAFANASAYVRDRGAASVHNPIVNAPTGWRAPDSHEGYMVQSLHTLTGWDYGDFAEHANRLPDFDALVLLPGWESSEGAIAEKAVAVACGIDVVELGDAS